MKLLLDANISWRLAEKLKLHFEECFHVDHIGLEMPATDTEIWNYALANNFIIVTNDEDFLNFSNIKSFPPKIILLRTGNQSNSFIEALLIKHKVNIQSLDLSVDYGVLELF
jgi:predicted nuclease of predicted toxin-antitoxin system